MEIITEREITMNSEKTLKKYIAPAGILTPLCWLLALAGIALLGLGIRQTGIEDDPSAAKAFNPLTAKHGDYVYMDVGGVSDWLYKATNDGGEFIYYAAEDASGNGGYILILDDEQFDELSAQNEYWKRTESALPTDVQRIYGTARWYSPTVRNSLAELIAEIYTDVPQEEFDSMFGKVLLNATVQPSGELATAYSVGGAVFLVLWFIVALIRFISRRSLRQNLKYLDKCNFLDLAAQELSSPDNTVIGKDQVRVSEHFLYGKRKGIAVLLDDILWYYKEVINSNDVTLTHLVLRMQNGRSYNALSIVGNDKNELADRLLEVLALRCPDALVDYSPENAREYKAIRKGKSTKGAAKAAKAD